jgi:hypothetical protein
MAAVWPLVVRRVFLRYISFALLGVILIEYMFELIEAIYLVFRFVITLTYFDDRFLAIAYSARSPG